MSTTINDIKAGIEARLAISAPTYNKLAYQIDISRNKFKGNSLGYSVQPAGSAEVDSLIGAFTNDHQFSIFLTNSYNEGAKSQIGDTLKSTRVTELMDVVLDVYKDLVVNKSSVDSTVLVINNLAIEPPEFIDEEKVIIVQMSINIKYKINK